MALRREGAILLALTAVIPAFGLLGLLFGAVLWRRGPEARPYALTLLVGTAVVAVVSFVLWSAALWALEK